MAQAGINEAHGLAFAARRRMFTDLANTTRAVDTPSRKADLLPILILPSWTGAYACRTLLAQKRLEFVSPSILKLGGGIAVRSP